MPSYEYKCTDCNLQYEVQQKISDPKLIECPSCHKTTLERLISCSTSFVLVGSGWAKDNYSSRKT